MHRFPRNKIKPFQFKQEPEMPPIKLSPQHQKMAETISHKYPLLPKIGIAVIIQAALEVLRDLLIKGCILNIMGFFNNFKLYFHQHKKNGKTNIAVRVSLTTPKELKNPSPNVK